MSEQINEPRARIPSEILGDAYEAFDRFEKCVEQKCDDGSLPDGFVQWWNAAGLGERASLYTQVSDIAKA